MILSIMDLTSHSRLVSVILQVLHPCLGMITSKTIQHLEVMSQDSMEWVLEAHMLCKERRGQESCLLLKLPRDMNRSFQVVIMDMELFNNHQSLLYSIVNHNKLLSRRLPHNKLNINILHSRPKLQLSSNSSLNNRKLFKLNSSL